MNTSVKDSESKENKQVEESKEANEGLDDYGYEKTKEDGEESKEEDKEESKDETGYTEESKEEDKDGEESKEDIKDETGYTEESKEEDKDEKDEETKEDKDDIEAALKDLPENIDKERITKFAKDNKLTKEQLEAYVKVTKEDNENAAKNQKSQLLETRKKWKDELYNDSDFGQGSKEVFDKNIFEVNKTLNKHLPNMKKALTDKGIVLPPYIMRDLLGISKLINPKTGLVKGEPAKPASKEKTFLEEMYD